MMFVFCPSQQPNLDHTQALIDTVVKARLHQEECKLMHRQAKLKTKYDACVKLKQRIHELHQELLQMGRAIALNQQYRSALKVGVEIRCFIEKSIIPVMVRMFSLNALKDMEYAELKKQIDSLTVKLKSSKMIESIARVHQASKVKSNDGIDTKALLLKTINGIVNSEHAMNELNEELTMLHKCEDLLDRIEATSVELEKHLHWVKDLSKTVSINTKRGTR